MLKIAIVVADGSEDIEVVTPTDIWRRSGIIVKLISVEKKKNVILANGTKISCESILLEENLSQYNAIYLPGGKGYLKFNDTNASKLVKFVQKNYNNPKMYFMALCAAPVCFYNWGIITPNLQLTCYPGMQIGKFEKNYVNKPVVVSNNFVTGSGPGTAHIFALTVVELLCGRQIAEEIAQKTLFK